MPQFALNHVTVARLGYAGLLDVAERTGCKGIEVRNDLPQALFDGLDPAEAGAMARDRGLTILAVAEVKRFNDWSEAKAEEARALMGVAAACGALAVSLIPRNDGLGMGNGERQGALRVALRALVPMLEDHGLVGLVEPLGFPTCALRHKAEAVEAIEALGAGRRVRLVHDTFHHQLAQDGQPGGKAYPGHTGIVHVSGVTDPSLAAPDMADRDRGLVDRRDRLANVEQLRALRGAGWDGPVSFECFAPGTHAEADPVGAIRRSMDHIEEALAARAA